MCIGSPMVERAQGRRVWAERAPEFSTIGLHWQPNGRAIPRAQGLADSRGVLEGSDVAPCSRILIGFKSICFLLWPHILLIIDY